ncbi:hypothetical protein JKP88DRAFT_284941 [Tribonema minus]|uniref:Uncharacterized protein n=1 Tax=Tribonema minus TaxID=303371 RepID=A0A835ZN96_9STRA|nr:hypothetical protein JKP88DRAFT_284941 [Tribonema minus]
MSVPGGARPKALKGIALARLRSALSAALHMAYSGRVMTHMAESRGGGHMEEDVGEDPEMPFGGGGGRKLLEAVATEYASRMSVPGGARPKALKGIALARLRSALSAALHMAYSGRVMTLMAESRGGGHMEEDVGEDPEMPFGGGGV